MPLLSLAAAILVIVLLNQLFYRTALGRAFRATSDDAETAQLMGIDNDRIYAIAMGLAHGGCRGRRASSSAAAPTSIRPSARRG